MWHFVAERLSQLRVSVPVDLAILLGQILVNLVLLDLRRWQWARDERGWGGSRRGRERWRWLWARGVHHIPRGGRGSWREEKQHVAMPTKDTTMRTLFCTALVKGQFNVFSSSFTALIPIDTLVGNFILCQLSNLVGRNKSCLDCGLQMHQVSF